MTVFDPVQLRERLLEVSAALPFEVTTRPMMGGFIGYADGRVFVSLSSGGFGIKLLPTDQETLLQRDGSERMRHLPSLPPSKTYIALDPSDIDDDDILTEWLRRAAATAPPAKPRAKRTP